MQNSSPFGRLGARCAGAGPLVVCLHSSAGSGQQWQALAEVLAPRFAVACVDSHGHGRSPAADPGTDVLAQDVAALGPAIAGAHDGVHLVGHSYGAALALCLALAFPARVRSLALYEPVLFSTLDDARMPPDAREEIGQVARAVIASVRAGQPQPAARRFIDYWSGSGSWQALGARQQRSIAARMPVVAAQFEALFAAGITPRHLSRVVVPTLLMSGARSRRSTLAIADGLQAAWPHARPRRFDGLGHLGPIADAAAVNAEIARHLGAAAGTDGALPPRTCEAGPSIMRPGDGTSLSLQGARQRSAELRVERRG